MRILPSMAGKKEKHEEKEWDNLTGKKVLLIYPNSDYGA